MPILVIVIVVSLIFYLFYKTRYFRTRLPMEKKWLSAKSNMAIGLFIAAFGLNRLLIDQSTVSILVGLVFLALGVVNISGGFKAYKYYLPLAAKEAIDVKKA